MPLNLVRATRASRPDRTTLFALALALAIGLYVVLVGRGTSNAAALSAASSDTTLADSAASAADRLTALTLMLPGVPDLTFSRQQVPTGLRQIAAVLEALMPQDPVGASAYASVPDDLRSAADRLEKQPLSVDGAVSARAAFISTSEVVGVLQRRDYPDLERAAAELRDAALGVRSDASIVEQRSDVELFFQRASDAFRGMAGSS